MQITLNVSEVTVEELTIRFKNLVNRTPSSDELGSVFRSLIDNFLTNIIEPEDYEEEIENQFVYGE